MRSGVGYGISIAGSAIADALARRRERSEVDKALQSLLLSQKISSTGAITPEDRARLADMGVPVADEASGITRTNEDVVRDIIARAASESPNIIAQNPSAFMQPLDQLVGQRQASGQLEALMPFLQSSGLKPEEIQSLVSLGQTDPQGAAGMLADLYQKSTSAFLQNEGAGRGEAAGFLSPIGQTAFETELGRREEGEVRTYKEKAAYSHELQKKMLFLEDSLYRSRAAASSKSDSDKEKAQTESAKTRIYGTVDDLVKEVKDLPRRRDENIREENEARTELAESGSFDDKVGLMSQVFPGVTKQDVALTAKTATLLGQDGFATVKEELLQKGLISGSPEDEAKIRDVLYDYGAATSEEPGRNAKATPQVQQAMNRLASARANREILARTEGDMKRKLPGLLDQAEGLLETDNDRAEFRLKRSIIQDTLLAPSTPQATNETIPVSGVTTPTSEPGFIGRAASGVMESVGGAASKVGEDVSGFFTNPNIEAVKDSAVRAREQRLSGITSTINSAGAPLNIEKTLERINKDWGDMSDTERATIRDTIRARNLELRTGKKATPAPTTAPTLLSPTPSPMLAPTPQPTATPNPYTYRQEYGLPEANEVQELQNIQMGPPEPRPEMLPRTTLDHLINAGLAIYGFAPRSAGMVNYPEKWRDRDAEWEAAKKKEMKK